MSDVIWEPPTKKVLGFYVVGMIANLFGPLLEAFNTSNLQTITLIQAGAGVVVFLVMYTLFQRAPSWRVIAFGIIAMLIPAVLIWMFVQRQFTFTVFIAPTVTGAMIVLLDRFIMPDRAVQ